MPDLPRDLPPELRKRRKLPDAHAQQKGKTLALFIRQLLLGQMLLRKILRHALQPLYKRRGRAAADQAEVKA